MTVLWHMCVVIPARNEELLLPRCLQSVLAARRRLPAGVTSDTVVAVDQSTDATLALAQRMLRGAGAVVCVDAGAVGHARGRGTELALLRRTGAEEHCWIANTDADCEVPETWLADQMELAEAGLEAVAGTVDVDSYEEHHPLVRVRFHASYLIHADGSHPHVHGANLGVRGDAYLRAGGWCDLQTGEDHDLWGRLAGTGARLLSTNRTRVLTSGRRVGRAPGGFADALAAHNEALP